MRNFPSIGALAAALLAFAAFVAPSSALDEPGCRVRIELTPALDREQPLEGTVLFRSADAEEWQEAQIAGDSVLLELRPGKTWLLTADALQMWAPLEGLNITSACEKKDHELRLWPLGHVTTPIVFAELGAEEPPEVTARIRPARRGSHGPRGRVTCSLKERNTLVDCGLPAGELEVTFLADGYAPVYRRTVEVVQGGSTKLAKVFMRPGASLIGRVENSDGGSLQHVKARLSPSIISASTPKDELQHLVGTAEVGEDGFFQIAGLSPGAYMLEVESPGYVTASVFPLELHEGQESALKAPVLLHRPMKLAIELSPPRDWLDSPWQVRLSKASSQSAIFEGTPEFEGSAGKDGRVPVSDQSQGRYLLEVADSLGNSFHTDAFLNIEPGHDGLILVELDIVWLEGRIHMGDEPVVGTLYFGGKFGMESVAVPVDENGEFLGTLPREGEWLVEVDAEDLETHVDVQVENGPGGKARLEIELPDTQVHGRVVDEQGRPVGGAAVKLNSELSSVKQQSNDDGKFEFRGLAEGYAQLAAQLSTSEVSYSSEATVVAVNDGAPVGPVELRLQASQSFSGLVTGPLGPIPGAVLRLAILEPNIPFGTRVTADAAGRFTAQIPEQASLIVAIVSPPGHTLQTFEIDPNVGEATLHVPRHGGTLSLAVPLGPENTTQRSLLDVLQDGRPLSVQVLYEWSAAHGSPLQQIPGPNGEGWTKIHLPQMAPGTYRICLYPVERGWYRPGESNQEISERLREGGSCITELLGEQGLIEHIFEPLDQG